MSDKSILFSRAWNIDELVEPDIRARFPIESEFPFAATLGRNFRFDFAFPSVLLAVEVDGGQWVKGGGRHNRDSDREKMNIAATLGWRVMRFSTQQLESDPVSCVEMVIGALYLDMTGIFGGEI